MTQYPRALAHTHTHIYIYTLSIRYPWDAHCSLATNRRGTQRSVRKSQFVAQQILQPCAPTLEKCIDTLSLLLSSTVYWSTKMIRGLFFERIGTTLPNGSVTLSVLLTLSAQKTGPRMNYPVAMATRSSKA